MITSTVMQRGPAHFNQVGQFLGYPLKDVDVAITPALVQRLVRYASKRFADVGFAQGIAGADVEVYTADADEKPANRSYTVKFEHRQGGYVELCGILTQHGWPMLDHGFNMGATR